MIFLLTVKKKIIECLSLFIDFTKTMLMNLKKKIHDCQMIMS